jgi:hypothetical protein
MMLSSCWELPEYWLDYDCDFSLTLDMASAGLLRWSGMDCKVLFRRFIFYSYKLFTPLLSLKPSGLKTISCMILV